MAELQWVATQINQDIETGLRPEQVLVIATGPRYRDVGHVLLRQQLEQYGHEVNCVWLGDPKVFATDGEVTVSVIHRAKGNEAASVYLIGLETIQNPEYRESAVHRRNEAFVGITRSRTWCTITGVEEEGVTILEEVKRVAAAVSRPDPEITFPIPDPKKLDHELEDDPRMETTKLFDFAD
ncbi:ATP-binding domain-containing protein [Natronosalvus halobius]|uniref:ATP-binding domain-containing protein n=1 Tax=Natronosalvus halobius TaxID=2953746 RepID=UPI0020A1D96C|nr:ATP-binding domain-containing protein [Natronosalvus halobius]USZ72269.1 ATP-binding domain-containing protein [Natronosalvus halobius]